MKGGRPSYRVLISVAMDGICSTLKERPELQGEGITGDGWEQDMKFGLNGRNVDTVCLALSSARCQAYVRTAPNGSVKVTVF